MGLCVEFFLNARCVEGILNAFISLCVLPPLLRATGQLYSSPHDFSSQCSQGQPLCDFQNPQRLPVTVGANLPCLFLSSPPHARLSRLQLCSRQDGGAAEIDWGDRKAVWEAVTFCSLDTEIIDIGQILSQELLACMRVFLRQTVSGS